MDTAKRPTILVIEDHEYLRDMICAALETIGFTGIPAGLGRQGIELAMQTQPDAVLVDLRLPDMNGVDVAREVKQRFPQTPVIGMSGEMYDVVRSAFDAVLGKPFDVDELDRVLRELKVRHA